MYAGLGCIADCSCTRSRPRCVHYVKSSTSRCFSRALIPSQPVFFVHVPKSGGTSFRVAVEQSIGKGRVCGDYGSTSQHTSPAIQRHVYQDTNRNDTKLAKQLSSMCSLLIGHVPAAKYVQIAGLRRTAMIVRTPLDRLGSEYFHMYRRGSKESFDEYTSKRISKNGGELLNKILNANVIPI